MTGAVVLVSTAMRGVATVTLNRPEVGNAYTVAMLEALIAGLEGLAAGAGVRCVGPRRRRILPGRR